MFSPSKSQPKRKPLQIVQRNFKKGYISVLQESRIPNDGLADMTNMDIVQDSLVTPRPSTVAYGPEALGEIIGIGTFTKLVSGLPERWVITMQVISGVGHIVVNKDGGSWTDVGGSYDANAWVMFTQSNSRVYVSNGINTMSYYDINTGTIVTYSSLTNVVAPTLTASASLLSGTPSNKYYYVVTANNNVGETAAINSANVLVNKLRDNWLATGPDTIGLSWTAVTGATSYNVYIGTNTNSLQYLTTVTGTTYTDSGADVINTFKIAPPGNSTGGPKLKYMIDDNGQLFGVGDVDQPYYLWYSAQGANAGDFSPYNGGGYVGINYGGDSIPTAVKSFRDGKGNPVITVLTKGQAGTGKFYHAQSATQTVGDTIIPYYQVYEANGQSGTISPFGVVEANNNIYYPTGANFKSTGTEANIVNILATNSVSQVIDPDVRNLNLKAMDKCVGLNYNDRIYWALPNGTEENSEIWFMDLARNNLWVLRWTIAAKWLWLYEDNTGVTHFCALVDNTIVEFTKSVATSDQGVPFRTRVASGSMVWDESGVAIAAIQSQYFKLFFPKGTIQVNNYGLGEDITAEQTLGGETYSVTVSRTGYGQWKYNDHHAYGDSVGAINFYSQGVGVVLLEPDETLNQLSWEIITETVDCDYVLSTVTTIGTFIPNAYLGQ